MIYQNILETIGDTPLVRINRMNKNKNVKIYVKLEGQNPGGSIKDRIALKMIEEAEKTGELNHQKIILEATSGNTGIGLALAASIKKYKITLTMSAGMSDERKKMLRSFGVNLIETDSEKGTDGAILKAHELYNSNPRKYFMSNQFDNENNPLAHYESTALEIIKDLPEITHFVAGIGTSGTLMGIGKKLKEHRNAPRVKIIGVEPKLGHKIAGLKNMKESIVPKIYDESMLDDKIMVNDEDVYKTSRELVRQEGIFAGMSSGASMYAALKLSEKLKEGVIVALLPDRGEKYLSTDLFD